MVEKKIRVKKVKEVIHVVEEQKDITEAQPMFDLTLPIIEPITESVVVVDEHVTHIKPTVPK